MSAKEEIKVKTEKDTPTGDPLIPGVLACKCILRKSAKELETKLATIDQYLSHEQKQKPKLRAAVKACQDTMHTIHVELAQHERDKMRWGRHMAELYKCRSINVGPRTKVLQMRKKRIVKGAGRRKKQAKVTTARVPAWKRGIKERQEEK
jgi:hypothetical protein